MERRFQNYVRAFHEPCAVYTGPGPGSIIIRMQKLILNYTRLHEHPPFIHVHEHYIVVCVRTRIYIEDMRTKKVIECAVNFERIVFS